MTDQNKASSTSPCGVNPRLLEILICPVTGGPLIFDREACELVSKKAKLAFPIRDGLPIMLESEARDLETSS
ncbi:MAG: Trm112 family protein [Pseudomonadota bacterium]